MRFYFCLIHAILHSAHTNAQSQRQLISSALHWCRTHTHSVLPSFQPSRKLTSWSQLLFTEIQFPPKVICPFKDVHFCHALPPALLFILVICYLLKSILFALFMFPSFASLLLFSCILVWTLSGPVSACFLFFPSSHTLDCSQEEVLGWKWQPRAEKAPTRWPGHWGRGTAGQGGTMWLCWIWTGRCGQSW